MRTIKTITYLKISQFCWRLWLKIDKRKIIIKSNYIVNKLRLLSENSIIEKESNFNLTKISYSSIKIFNQKYDVQTKWKAEKPLISYHLNYFDFIHYFQRDTGLALINRWINENKAFNNISWDPYPSSLRIVNWIKFLNKNNIENIEIYNSLYKQAFILFKRREFHLLTNHLFKNIVGLLFAGVLFNENKWKKWALKELKKQLREQLTCDNYHFELSPTYHAIFTKDLLDIYNLLINNEIDENNKITVELKQIIPDALYWCRYFNENEKFININDANYEGCPTLHKLLKYAELLGLSISEKQKQNYHYPIIENNNVKLMMYCAEHQPSYNPAHSHDDLTSILLWYNNKPILVDSGNFCYDETAERDYSRSTKAHNCFTIDSENQSEMWKAFRIGRRSKIVYKKISANMFICSHNGYKKFGVSYNRTIKKMGSGFEIIDSFDSKKNQSYQIFFHFHPKTNLSRKEDRLIINETLILKIQSYKWKIIETEYYPEMFQKTKKKTVVISGKITDKQHLTIIEVIK